MGEYLKKEEKELLKSFEAGEWKSVGNLEKRKGQLRDNAKATLRKDKRINIRISEADLRKLQKKAIHEGMPYQTLISSVLHKFVNGSLKEQASH